MRQLRRGPIREFLNSINVPDKIKDQILFNDCVEFCDITRHIDMRIFHESISNDLETINNLLNEWIFDDNHNHRKSSNKKISQDYDLWYLSDSEEDGELFYSDDNSDDI